MTTPKSTPTPGRIADNAGAWPSLAYLLAPGAGCDCQMLALSLADGMNQPAAKPIRAAVKR